LSLARRFNAGVVVEDESRRVATIEAPQIQASLTRRIESPITKPGVETPG
jgi:hypothetical protein